MSKPSPFFPGPPARPCLGRVGAAMLVCLACTGSVTAQVDWRELQPPNRPPLVGGDNELVYDAARRRAVMVRTDTRFGTVGNLETWEWDGTTWTRATPARSPWPRHGFKLAYDGVRRQVVLFGGLGGGGLLGDTWVWDGVNWTQVASGGPARRAHYMAYDAARHEVVMFGGLLLGLVHATGTWVWDGASWRQRSSAQSPPTRHGGKGMVYDERRRQVVLFGGNPQMGTGIRLDDTWTWDGSNWQQRFPTSRPPARGSHMMVYDSGRDRAVVYGGATGSGSFFRDTWEWDGTTWVQRQPITRPRANWNGLAATYDDARQQVVLFGGYDSSCYPCGLAGAENATWVYGAARPGRFSGLGAGCAGSAGVPSLRLATGRLPYVGDTFELEVGNLPAGPRAALAVFGFSLSSPFSLAPIGMPTCNLHSSAVLTVVAVIGGVAWHWTIAVPADPRLVGQSFAMQSLIVDPPANAFGMIASDAGKAVLGSK